MEWISRSLIVAAVLIALLQVKGELNAIVMLGVLAMYGGLNLYNQYGRAEKTRSNARLKGLK